MERIIKIIMRRDDMSYDDASQCVKEAIENAQSLIMEGDFDGAEDAWMCDLGLEPDYLMEVLV